MNILLPSLQNTDTPIVLASSSPRRIEILNKLGIPIQVVPSQFPENLDTSLFKSPVDYVIRNALEKGKEVHETLFSSSNAQNIKPKFIISADTIVSFQDKILEKPESREHAIEILSMLSGNKHQVITGVTIIKCNQETGQEVSIESFHDVTNVWFNHLSKDMIEAYVSTGEPMDKAGAYGYQGLAGFLIEKIDGCYYNVVGFPAAKFFNRFNAMLKR